MPKPEKGSAQRGAWLMLAFYADGQRATWERMAEKRLDAPDQQSRDLRDYAQENAMIWAMLRKHCVDVANGEGDHGT